MRLKNFFSIAFSIAFKNHRKPLCLSRKIYLKKNYATEYRSTQSHLSIAKANKVLKEYLLRGYVVNTRIAALEQHAAQRAAS